MATLALLSGSHFEAIWEGPAFLILTTLKCETMTLKVRRVPDRDVFGGTFSGSIPSASGERFGADRAVIWGPHLGPIAGRLGSISEPDSEGGVVQPCRCGLVRVLRGLGPSLYIEICIYQPLKVFIGFSGWL